MAQRTGRSSSSVSAPSVHSSGFHLRRDVRLSNASTRSSRAHAIAISNRRVAIGSLYNRTMRAWALVVLVACTKPHVTLAPPRPDLTPQQRVEMFNQLRGDSEETTVTTSCSGGGGCSTQVEHTLYLAEGTPVYHPEDLLPVLPPDSESARAIREAHRLHDRQLQWALGGTASFLVGFIWFFARIGSEASTPELVGMGALALGGLVGAYGAYHFHFMSADEILHAHKTFSAGLAERLNVCVSGMLVVACEAWKSPSPPPSTGYYGQPPTRP